MIPYPLLRTQNSWWAWLLLAALSGCQRPDASSPAPAARPIPATLFARQLRDLREGRTDWIALESEVVTDDDLASLDGLTGLRELLIERSRITDEGLGHLARLTRLEHVRIREAAIGDAGIRQLARLPRLRIVNLPHAVFTDAALADLAGVSRLELLRFGSPHVTDAGLAQIRRMPQLRFLHLIDTPITDAGLRQLEDRLQLESLYLDGTRVTEEGIVRLLAALPELHLHIDQQHHDRDPRNGDHDHGSASVRPAAQPVDFGLTVDECLVHAKSAGCERHGASRRFRTPPAASAVPLTPCDPNI